MGPKFTFAISGITYLSVLLASFLLPIIYPIPRQYCWFLVPLVANFFVGYFAEEFHTAVKVAITFLLSHIFMVVMVIGLLWTPLFYDALMLYSPWDDPFGLITVVILSYSLMNIIFGVFASSIGTIIRSHIGQLKKLLPAKK